MERKLVPKEAKMEKLIARVWDRRTAQIIGEYRVSSDKASEENRVIKISGVQPNHFAVVEFLTEIELVTEADAARKADEDETLRRINVLRKEKEIMEKVLEFCAVPRTATTIAAFCVQELDITAETTFGVVYDRLDNEPRLSRTFLPDGTMVYTRTA